MLRKCLLSMGLLSLCLNAYADEFHYNNILIGDRASGMGGAYTAISDDPSGMFYNPAGIAYAKGNSMSASVNAYHAVSKKYDGVIGGNGWKRNSSALLPNYFGVLQPFGKLKAGFSYAVPDSSQEDQDQTFYNLASTIPGVTVDSYVINFNNSDAINNFGPSVATELTDNLSVGLTLYAHKRNSHLIFNQLVQLSNGSSEWTNQYLETDEWGVRPVVGLMWAPMDKLSVGLSLAKTFVFTSDTKLQMTGKDTVGTLTRSDQTVGDKREYPYQINAGVAWFPTPELLLSAELSYFTKEDYMMLGVRKTLEQVINGAIGAEYYLNRDWAVRGGFFTNRSNAPDVTVNDTGLTEKIDLYGGSLTLSHFTRNTSITAGGSFSYGSGDAHVRDTPAIQNATTSSWTLFVSSSYSY